MSKNKSENGLWIQHKVLYNKNMSTQEKFIVAQVIALHENGACFAGNRFFAEMLNVTTNRISKIISKLCREDYLRSSYDVSKPKKRFLMPNYERLFETTIGHGKNNHTALFKITKGIGENTTYNKNYNKKENEKLYRSSKNNFKQNNSRFEISETPNYKKTL